jgi:anti-anti-sigma factor
MEISETRIGATLVMIPAGRLNAESTQAFQECVLGRIDAGEACILLDLAQLEYISSAGLRSLLIAAKRAQALEGRFALCALSENVGQVFRMSGFDTIIDVHPDRDTALRSLA